MFHRPHRREVRRHRQRPRAQDPVGRRRPPPDHRVRRGHPGSRRPVRAVAAAVRGPRIRIPHDQGPDRARVCRGRHRLSGDSGPRGPHLPNQLVQGRAVLDSVRAAQRLNGSGLSAANPVGIVGYSQGGGGAASAAELAAAYAPEPPSGRRRGRRPGGSRRGPGPTSTAACMPSSRSMGCVGWPRVWRRSRAPISMPPGARRWTRSRVSVSPTSPTTPS